MGASVYTSTVAGGFTPTCNECGIRLCWDISAEDYFEMRAFWDAWICEVCNDGEALSMLEWARRERKVV